MPFPQVTVVNWTFDGDPLPPADQKTVLSSLESQQYGGNSSQVADSIAESARYALQNLGYFSATVEADARILTSSPVTSRAAATLHVMPGPQYRLKEIDFKNNRAVSNSKSLRSVFSIRDGEIFSRERIAKGLYNLRFQYASLGFINFTASPDVRINAQTQSINLSIDIDEGKQFYISSLDVVGLDYKSAQRILQSAIEKPGDFYNQRLMELMVKQAGRLPEHARLESIIQRELNQRAGTVAVTLDFRPRLTSCQASTVAAVVP